VNGSKRIARAESRKRILGRLLFPVPQGR
jgi:hypothetical protein